MIILWRHGVFVVEIDDIKAADKLIVSAGLHDRIAVVKSWNDFSQFEMTYQELVISGVIPAVIAKEGNIDMAPGHIQTAMQWLNGHFPPSHPYEVDELRQKGYVPYNLGNDRKAFVFDTDLGDRFVGMYDMRWQSTRWYHLDATQLMFDMMDLMNKAKRKINSGGRVVVDGELNILGLWSTKEWEMAIEQAGGEVEKIRMLTEKDNVFDESISEALRQNRQCYRLSAVFQDITDNSEPINTPAEGTPVPV